MIGAIVLSGGQLLGVAAVAACLGLAAGLGIAGWIATRDPTTDRRGTGFAPNDENPRIEPFREGSERGQIKRIGSNGPPPRPPPPPPPSPPRLTPIERRKYRS